MSTGVVEEDIMAALFALLERAAAFKTASRRMRLWGEVGAGDKPALFLMQGPSDYLHDSEACPNVITLHATVWIYTEAGKDTKVVPATQLNELVAAVRNALRPNALTGLLTLGGLAAHCWIEGNSFFDAGDLDGDGVASLPLRILVPVLA